MKRLLVVVAVILAGCPPAKPEPVSWEARPPTNAFELLHEKTHASPGPDVWRMPLEGGWLVVVCRDSGGTAAVWVPDAATIGSAERGR